MKIILIPNSWFPQIGGLEIAVLNLAQELNKKGNMVLVLTTASIPEFPKRELFDKVVVYKILYTIPRFPAKKNLVSFSIFVIKCLVWPVYAFVSQCFLLSVLFLSKPDVVNLHYIGDNAFYLIIARILKKFNLIVSIHGPERLNRRIGRNVIIKKLIKQADMIIANSQHSLNKVENLYSNIRDKSVVIDNGIYLEEFDNVNGYKKEKRYIFSARRFSFSKGMDLLVRAFSIVHQHYSDIKLLLAGDGKDKIKCEEISKKLKIIDYIIFLGAISHSKVISLLKSCEIFVLPSRKEAFGIVLLEAMACGKPIVATRVGGVPEVVREGENAILVEPESPQALAEGIVKLLENSDLAKRFGERGREIVKNFTWDKIVERYINTYNSVLTKG